MRHALKRVLPAPVLGAVRRARLRVLEAVTSHATLSYAQEGEDMILRSIFFAERTPGFYVDVGAHHPRRFSNTFLFYRMGWRGINIEPNPEAAAPFRRQRGRDVNLSMGVSDRAGELAYFMFDEPAVNCFGEEAAELTERETTFRVRRRLAIPVRRLDDLLAEHLPAGQRISFLTVDVEGHDLEVLRSNDWTHFRPRCVVVEARGCTLDAMTATPVHRFLHAQRFELVAKTLNTLIYQDGQPASSGDGAG